MVVVVAAAAAVVVVCGGWGAAAAAVLVRVTVSLCDCKTAGLDCWAVGSFHPQVPSKHTPICPCRIPRP